MYPLKFTNIYKDKPWGNKKLKKFRDDVPTGKIGESWNISCRDEDMSVVSEGEFSGKTLLELIDEYKEGLVGTALTGADFPLLIKILSVSEKLSVQVHPDDEYAKKDGEEYGKEEIWYIMDAKRGAQLILGTNGCTREEFELAIIEGKSEDMMRKLPIKKGEVYYVKSGLIHTVDGEVMVAEIQQNSDLTYRVYDYDRGRELHIEKALDSIRFELEGKKSPGLTAKYKGYAKTWYALSSKFSLELYKINREVVEESDPERFYIFMCVKGKGTIKYEGGEVKFAMGDTVLIPATLGEYTISGGCRLLKTYVPDVAKVEQEIIAVIK